ncbi:MAG: CBS domain-containing protein [bacterium]|nr:CBS domain-containing protein [bacterium]
MGEQKVKSNFEGGAERRVFMRRLLDDLRALEHIIADGMIESGVRRIGAEQEFFLIDKSWRPACAALKVLDSIDDDHFTTELGQFNLEMNLDPAELSGDCLSQLERALLQGIDKARRGAEAHGLDVVLAGILPTLRKSDLALENMTPMPRYFALNNAMSALRGGAYEFHIKGLDELLIKHDSVMVEACNASFQVHFQVGAEEFANLYNISQVVAGPTLAAAVNSPVLFGRQLWRETRIALFQQAVDTRSSMDFIRERSPRVTFGNDWIHESVLELFQEDISRFRALVTSKLDERPLEMLSRGEVPTLQALRLHNGTVYRWNRACYGFTDGKPHLRIENRVLPSGPSIVDEVANAAFWFGLISAMSHRYPDIRRMIPFQDAKMNFSAAARLGLGAQFSWFDGTTRPAANLIVDTLIPLAQEGLEKRGIDSSDIDRYLGVIEQRVSKNRTGSQWIMQSLSGMRGRVALGEQLNALTAAMVARQKVNRPVGDWEPAHADEAGGWKHNFLKVEQYMTTDLYTVHEDESLDLVACLMEWKRIRHVPVENHEHELVGLISYRSLLKLMARGGMAPGGKKQQLSAADVMTRDPFTIAQSSTTLEAIELMRRNGISCLPVVKDQRLVGIITERDFMNVAAELMAEQLKD